MKILLADDEKMVRLGLISMLDELYSGEMVYIEARNGKEMLELMDSYSPDIAFVDIKMPLMDGLTALKECRKRHPLTQYLILSGYSDFEYARIAMHFGAQEYLLKPVGLEALKHTIETARENLKQSIRESNNRFAQVMIAAYNATRSTTSDQEASMANEYGNTGIFIFFIDHYSKETYERIFRALIHGVHFELDKYLSRSFHYVLTFLETGEPCLVTCGDKNVIPVLSSLLPCLGSPVTCMYCECVSPSNLYHQCIDIVNIASVRMISGYGRLIGTDTLLLRKAASCAVFLSEMEKLHQAFLDMNEMEYKNIINRLDMHSKFSTIFEEASRPCIESYFKLSMGISVSTKDYKEFIGSLSGGLHSMYRNNEIKTEADEITWIKEYVRDNYMKDTGVNVIAQLLHISPNYLSRIFHERVGCKFIDYLTEVRITNAKRFLASNPQITIKEVAGRVGYSSCRHFTRTFTRLVGCFPSEYTKSLFQ